MFNSKLSLKNKCIYFQIKSKNHTAFKMHVKKKGNYNFQENPQNNLNKM